MVEYKLQKIHLGKNLQLDMDFDKVERILADEHNLLGWEVVSFCQIKDSVIFLFKKVVDINFNT